jgi:hypothetical protein
MDRRLGRIALVAALGALAACGGKKAAPARAAASAHDAGTAPTAGTTPKAAPPAGDDGGGGEIDAAPIRPGDVLEGSAAETAMAEALAHDAGEPAGPGAPPSTPADDPLATGLTNDGVAGYRLGLARAEVVKRLGVNVPIVRLPRATPDAPLSEETLARTAEGMPWLRLRLLAGRVVQLEVLARDGRALTDEGIGVGSTFEEAVLAHGEARAVVDEKTNRVRGWVLADLPGLLWVATGVPIAPAADGPTPPPEGARVARVLVLGAEALAPPD